VTLDLTPINVFKIHTEVGIVMQLVKLVVELAHFYSDIIDNINRHLIYNI